MRGAMPPVPTLPCAPLARPGLETEGLAAIAPVPSCLLRSCTSGWRTAASFAVCMAVRQRVLRTCGLGMTCALVMRAFRCKGCARTCSAADFVARVTMP